MGRDLVVVDIELLPSSGGHCRYRDKPRVGMRTNQFIETANIYGVGAAEAFLGEALSVRPRDSLIPPSKAASRQRLAAWASMPTP